MDNAIGNNLGQGVTSMAAARWKISGLRTFVRILF